MDRKQVDEITDRAEQVLISEKASSLLADVRKRSADEAVARAEAALKATIASPSLDGAGKRYPAGASPHIDNQNEPDFSQKADVPAADASQEDKRTAQQVRSKKFGIEALDGAGENLSYPAGYPTDLADYGDPVNLKYPLKSDDRARNARARFKQQASTYKQESSRRVVHERIVERLLEIGAKPSYDPKDPLDKLLPKTLVDQITSAEKASKITFEEESDLIRENKKKPQATARHKFKAATWTHPNGHPRCIVCGDEETTSGYCNDLTDKVAKATTIQTLIFDKTKFKTVEDVATWVKAHGFHMVPKESAEKGGIEEQPNTWRVRQRPPDDFMPDTFRTIDITDGVKAVIGQLKDTAKKAEGDGAMVAVLIPPDALKKLKKAGVKIEVDPPHVTLLYLGDVPVDDDMKTAFQEAAAEFGSKELEARIAGFGSFQEGPDGIPVVALIDCPGLSALQAEIEDAAGFEDDSPSDHGFIPHMTIGYDVDVPAALTEDIAFMFDSIAIVQGDNVVEEIKLGVSKHKKCSYCGDCAKRGDKCCGKSGERVVKLIPVDKAATEEETHVVLGIAMEPDEVDTQGDTEPAPVVRRAAHEWLARFQNRGLMHKELVNEKVEIFESYVTSEDLKINGQFVKKGSWLLMYHILDDALWTRIKSGDLTGFSIGGFARRVDLRAERTAA